MTFDPIASAEFWKSRNQTERAALVQMTEQARQEALRLARLFKEEAGAEAVYLFGSLAEGTTYHSAFDIDLAMVKGDFFVAFRLAQSCRFEVDLQEYEALPEHVQRRVDTHGVRLI